MERNNLRAIGTDQLITMRESALERLVFRNVVRIDAELRRRFEAEKRGYAQTIEGVEREMMRGNHRS